MPLQLTIFSILPFLTGTAFAALATLAWRGAARRAVKRTLATFLALMACWSFTSSLLHSDAVPGHAVWLARLVVVAGPYSGVLYYFFIRAYIGRLSIDRWQRLGVALAPIVLLYALLGDVVLEARLVDGAFVAEFGRGMAVVTVYGLLFYALVTGTLLAQRRRAEDQGQRVRLSYLLVGYSVVLLSGFTNFDSTLNQYPLDQMGNLVNASIVAYVVLRHDLLETTTRIRRGALYTLLTAATTAFYLGIVLVSVALVDGSFDMGHAVIGFAVALLVSIVFQPALTAIQRWIDRVFLRDEYEYRLVLGEWSQAMASSLELEALSSTLLELIGRTMHVDRLGLLILDESRSGYYLVMGDRYYQQSPPQLDPNHPVVQRMEKSNVPLTKREILALPQFYSLWQSEREQIMGVDFELLVPLVAKQVLVGILVLGRKRSAQRYTVEEISLLTTLGNQAAVAIDKARLYEELRSSYEQLQSAQDKLVQAERLRTLGEVAAGIAHDFNNLLLPLTMFPELIKTRVPRDHPVVPLCDTMLDAAEQMVATNRDLLALGRRGGFAPEAVDLNRIVEQAVATAVDRPPSLTVRLKLGDALLPVNGAGSQLVRVAINLISNARDAMNDEGVLTLKTENVYLDEPGGPDGRIDRGEYVRLTVSDTGPGIPPETREKIFDAFYSTKRTDRRRGSGLGLSVVQAIVDDHKGFIELRTEVDKGTCFDIYLPIYRGATGPSPSEDVRGGNESILVVDDDPLQQRVVREVLTSLGYRVDGVTSGEKALDYLGRQPVDLVLLDMVMPSGMDGAETYRRILEIRPRQRAIVVSGFAPSERVQEAQALGITAFFLKPLTREKLARAVRWELDGGRGDPAPGLSPTWAAEHAGR